MKKFGFAAVLLAALALAAAAAADIPSDLKVGDTITFGRYEQDNDLTNGLEPIEWRVLEVTDGEALCISQYALDAKPYNEKRSRAYWVKSYLRSWLSTEFYNTAFSDEEKQQIVTKEIENWREDSTSDPVILLSTNEAKRLFSSHADRQAKATPYAVAQGAWISEKYVGYTQWWLRTLSWENHLRASYVAASGGVMTCGGNSFGKTDNAKLTVRPAIYVKLGSE